MAKIIGWIVVAALVIGLLLPPLSGEAPWPSLNSDRLRAYFRGVVDYWKEVFSSSSGSSGSTWLGSPAIQVRGLVSRG